MRLLACILFIILTLTGELKAQCESNIVLIDVGLNNREEIAKMISKINSLNPKVISIAFEFPERSASINNNLNENTYVSITGDDQTLQRALTECSHKLVLSVTMEKRKFKSGEVSKSFKGNDPRIMPFGIRVGFTNIEEIGKDSVSNLKYFPVYEKIKKNTFGGVVVKTVYQFGIRTAMVYDSMKTMNFINKNHRMVELDKNRKFFVKFSQEDFTKERLLLKDIEGKIIMIGFMGPGNADKYFSPWNKTQDAPDIYGVEYQAHVVAQVLGWK